MNDIKKSILAGILIGLGVIINLQSQPPALGALLFSFGLLVIINMQLNLYTGKIGFYEKWNLKFLITMLIMNWSGILIIVGLYMCANPGFRNILSAAAAAKFSKDATTLFLNACFCGMLIHLAVKNKVIILTIFSVMIFILIGAEHCIADFPYLLSAFSLENCFKLISIVLGNSLGALTIERLSE